MRHTSTSTSNYNSTSDMPSYLRGFDSSLHRHREGEKKKYQCYKNDFMKPTNKTSVYTYFVINSIKIFRGSGTW